MSKLQSEFNKINIQHSKLRKQSSEMKGALDLENLLILTNHFHIEL